MASQVDRAAHSEMNDTAAGEPIVTRTILADGASASNITEKICCVCGENVAGKPRMKDREGRYWCYECGMADTQRKRQMAEASAAGTTVVVPQVQSVQCPDCQQNFVATELVDYEGFKLCGACSNKRRMAKKRAEARAAAAAEEELRAAQRRKIVMIVTAIAVLMVIGWAVLTVVR